MKLHLGQAESKFESTTRFWSDRILPVMKSILVRAIALVRLMIRILLNGYRPKIRQGCDRDNNLYWYAYYPVSGVSKVLASEAEIKQWLEFTL